MAVGLGAMNLLWRFMLGGVIVSLFAFIGDIVRPKRFAGRSAPTLSVFAITSSATMLCRSQFG
jgi:hypothetical protein